MKKNTTKLTPELQEKFCTLIANNSHVEVAAKALGLSGRTVYNWINWGEDETDGEGKVTRKAKEPFITFRQEYEKAQATAELMLIDSVKNQGGWKGAAWLLSRRYGERWREQKHLEMVGAGGSPLMPQAAPAVIIITDTTTGKSAPWIQEDERAAG
jgi:hypothetical protein